MLIMVLFGSHDTENNIIWSCIESLSVCLHGHWHYWSIMKADCSKMSEIDSVTSFWDRLYSGVKFYFNIVQCVVRKQVASWGLIMMMMMLMMSIHICTCDLLKCSSGFYYDPGPVIVNAPLMVMWPTSLGQIAIVSRTRATLKNPFISDFSNRKIPRIRQVVISRAFVGYLSNAGGPFSVLHIWWSTSATIKPNCNRMCSWLSLTPAKDNITENDPESCHNRFARR